MANKSMWLQLREIWQRYSEIRRQRRAELKGRWYKQYAKRQQQQQQKYAKQDQAENSVATTKIAKNTDKQTTATAAKAND